MSGAVLSTVLTGLAAIGGLSGLAALFKVFSDRTTIRADAVDKIADVSTGMLKPLHEEIDRLSAKLTLAENQVDALQQQVRSMRENEAEASILRRQLERLRDEVADKDRQIMQLLGSRRPRPDEERP